MEIKNKLSLEKKSILTLNKVDMGAVQGGTHLTTVTARTVPTRVWLDALNGASIIAETIEIATDAIRDLLHRQSDTVETRTSGRTSEAIATYGGCMVSEVEVTCS